MQGFKEVELQEIFDFSQGNGKLTIKYIHENQGIYPVYSSQTVNNGLIGSISTYDFDCECLTWTTRGERAGTVFYRKKHRFALTNNCGRMILLRNDIDYIYAKYVIENTIKATIGNTYGIKVASESILRNLVISIPIKKDGSFDLEKQKEIAKRYQVIEKIQDRLEEAYKTFKNTNVVVSQDKSDFTEVDLGNKDIFTIFIGKRVLKKDIKDKGIPIYSSNVLKEFGFSTELPYKEFNKPVLLWGIDGDFEWNIIPANTKFIPTDHCGVLEVNSKEIDIEYLLYELRATKLQYGFDRTFRASLDNMVNVVARIPKDIKLQQQIASKYKEIEKIQNYLTDNLKILKSCNVAVSCA
jgi:restriction endonuclease S subunit